MPYTYGDAVLPCDVVDYTIEVDEPLTSPTPRAVSDVSRQIGERVADFIVSEQGTAHIWGHDADEQANQIIDNVAHPDARAELRDAGRLLGFSPH